jgi:hypothetical protein
LKRGLVVWLAMNSWPIGSAYGTSSENSAIEVNLRKAAHIPLLHELPPYRGASHNGNCDEQIVHTVLEPQARNQPGLRRVPIPYCNLTR